MPKAYREALNIKGRVRMELTDDGGLVIHPVAEDGIEAGAEIGVRAGSPAPTRHGQSGAPVILAAAEAMSDYAIDAQGVTRTYHVGEQEVHTLRGIDLQIAPGRFVALKGRSGSGKTTLLNCLGGLDQPTDGVIQIHGRDLIGLPERTLTDWRRREVGFIFQSLGLLPNLSAYENVELMLRIAKTPAG